MLLSRLADNMFWIGRYLERAENTARLINVTHHLMLDLPAESSLTGWESLMSIMGCKKAFEELHKGDPSSKKTIQQFLLSNKANPSSVIGAIYSMRENVRAVRDILPRETWHHISEVYLQLRNMSSNEDHLETAEFLSNTMQSCSLISGFLQNSMIRDLAYRFMQVGRFVERADMCTRILDVRAAVFNKDIAQDRTFEALQWSSVLQSMSAYQAYRRHVRMRVKGADVVTFLLGNAEFPRSFAYCIRSLERNMTYLPDNIESIECLQKLKSSVESVDMSELLPEKLSTFLDDLQVQINEFTNGFSNQYLHLVTPEAAEAG